MKPKSLPLIVFLFLLFWEISNPGALRQGTEGFYLKIAQEMSQSHNFLTPTYLHELHWSKPPLHFWLPQGLSLLGFKFSILSARLSILFFSLGCIYYLSKILHRITLKPLNLYFTVLITSFAFLKYSRIYMMEAPLALLCAIAVITFYEFFEKNNRSSFYTSCFCAGLSCLIKGPVSLVMIFSATGVYVLTSLTYGNIKRYSFFVLLTLILASPWFIISLYHYGKDFYYYFFIRENLGKFTSKSYPLSSVFYGLLAYSLPMTFFLPNLIKYSKKLRSDKFFIFVFLSFTCFFAIWLFPSQRSYHYSIPSIPFFLILIIQASIPLKDFKFINYSFLGVCILLITTSIFFFSPQIPAIRIYLTMALLFFAFFIMKTKSLTNNLLANGIVVLTFLNIFLPTFYRPVLPENVVRYFDNHNAPVVIIKHPYYLEDLINKPVTVIDIRDLSSTIASKPGHYITSRSNFNTVKDSVKELTHWAVWRRGLSVDEIIQAMINRSTSSLEEDYVLFTNEGKYYNDRI
jgi:4-amino-4-deoxy-L-arabinose transferase-like glycosyltransferase